MNFECESSLERRVSRTSSPSLPCNLESALADTFAAYHIASIRRNGGLYLAKPYSAKSESAVQESGKPYFAQPGNC